MKHTIFIASDHAAFDLKKQIIENYEYFIDLGTYDEERVDYPDFATKLVSKIISIKGSKGILMCGSGVGMSISANRNKNIRAGLAYNSEVAKLIRQHNDANVLILPGRFMDIQEALKCVKNFLNSKFEGGRHKNRICKINK